MSVNDWAPLEGEPNYNLDPELDLEREIQQDLVAESEEVLDEGSVPINGSTVFSNEGESVLFEVDWNYEDEQTVVSMKSDSGDHTFSGTMTRVSEFEDVYPIFMLDDFGKKYFFEFGEDTDFKMWEGDYADRDYLDTRFPNKSARDLMFETFETFDGFANSPDYPIQFEEPEEENLAGLHNAPDWVREAIENPVIEERLKKKPQFRDREDIDFDL